MAWEGSNRAQRLPSDWPRRRAAALTRDGYRCTRVRFDDTRCPEPATDVDHIEPGDDHRLSNLASLCRWHHQRKSASEGGRAAWLIRPPKKRPSERHPGLLLLRVTAGVGGDPLKFQSPSDRHSSSKIVRVFRP